MKTKTAPLHKGVKGGRARFVKNQALRGSARFCTADRIAAAVEVRLTRRSPVAYHDPDFANSSKLSVNRRDRSCGLGLQAGFCSGDIGALGPDELVAQGSVGLAPPQGRVAGGPDPRMPAAD